MKLLFIIGGLIIGSSTSLAYPVSDVIGKVHRWDITSASPQLNYYNYDETNSGAVVDAAFARWAAVTDSYITFAKVGSPASADILLQIGAAGAGAGVSQFSLNDSGHILNCTVTVAPEFSGQTDVEAQVLWTHEIGHCLGLAHSVVDKAIMSYRASTESANLSIDDEAALVAIYPVGDELKLPPGCATVSTPSWPGVGGFLFLFPLVFLFLLRLNGNFRLQPAVIGRQN